MNSTTQTTPGAPKSRARKSVNAVAPSKENAFKAHQVEPSSSGEGRGPMYTRLYENHNGVTAEQALESIEAETCMKILQSISALPEKMLLGSFAPSESRKSQQQHSEEGTKESKHKDKERDRDREQPSRKKEKEKPQKQPKSSRLASDSDSDSKETYEKKKKKHRDKEKPGREEKREREREKEKEKPSPESMVPIAEYPTVENASTVPESELFTKFGFVPLELTVAELEPEIIEGGMFYATLPFKKKPSRARSRSSSSDRSRSNSNSTDTRDSGKLSLNKKKSVVITESKCAVCTVALPDDTSAYCSEKCLVEIVNKATKAFASQDEGVSIVSSSGGLHSCKPAVAELLDFLKAYPIYVPLIPAKTAAKGKPVAKKPQEEPVKEKAPPKPLTKESDAIRFNVRQSLIKELTQSIRAMTGSCDLTKSRALIEQLEMILFKKCEMNVKSNKYKEFVKALIMCFREGKNEISIRLMNGSLTVQKLALIDPEMLKCDESLAPLRPAEVQVSGDTQDSVESVETPTTVAVAAEEPSTSKSQTTAEAAKQQTPLFTLKTSIPGLGYAVPKKKVPTRQQVPANALDSILGDGKRDTTSQHLSHFFDANCSICATKMKSNAEAEKKDREEKEKMKEEIKKKRQELKITDRSFEFDSKRSSDYRFNDRDDDYDDNDYASPAGENSPGDRWNEADEDRDRDRDWNARPGRGSSRKDDSVNRSGGDSWRRSENWRYNEDEDENYRRGDRDFDRRRREEEEREERDERRPGTSRDERSEVRRRDAEGVKITKQQLQQLFMNPIIWRGQIVFNGVVFVSSLVALSGSSCFELTGQLPVSLKITGRIAPIVVFDYFSSIRLNKMYSIALYQIEQPMDDEGSRRFINLYMDMINKDRNFVIEVPCPLVREAYLLPLQPGQDPPAYLLPFDGPGILMSHGHMILCIMTLDTEPQGLDEVLPKAKAAVDGRISQLSNSSPRTDAASHGSADAIPPHSGSLPAPVPAPILAASAPMTTPTAKLDSSHDSDVVPLNESKPASVPAPALKDISSTSNAPEQQQSDELFPANFFDRIREKGQQQDESGTAATDSISAAVPMDPNSVRTLEDLLLYIELTESPKLIKDVVARFMADDSIPEEQKELIRTRVVNKITAAKNKRKMKDGEKSERRSKDDEQQGKEATVSAENDFQPTDECSTFADQTLHSVIDSARSKLNGSNEVGIDAARGDPTHSREIVPVSSMSMVGEAGSVRGPHTPEFDISEKYTIPPSSSAGDVSHPSAEASFPPLPTIPPPPSKRTLPSALGPFGMPPPMTSMAPPLFNTSAPPPLYPSHPGPLYNAPLPQFPPSQSLFNQPVPATPFVAAHIDSTSNRGSIIDFFNSAGGFKPTTEIAPIPPELIHNKSIFSGGIAPGFGRTRSESRSPSPNGSPRSPRSPQIGPGPSLSPERRPTIRPSTIAGRRILPGARVVRPPRPPRTPSPDPYELVRKQVIEERDRRRAQEADEKEERRRRLEEERRDYKERKRKREEEMLESLPGPVKVQRGLWDERMDELSQQAAEKSRAVNAEIRGGEMSSRLSDDEDPNERKNREGRGSREWKKPMVAQDQDAWQEENPWKKKKIRGKKKKKLVDGAAGGQEQTETEQGEVDEGDETNTAKETMDAQTVVEKTPQEAANKDKEANRFDDFDDSDIGMSFEKQPEKEKEQQQEEPQENPFWDVEMPVLEFGSTKHRDVPPQRREKQPPPPPKNRGKGKGQQQQRHGAEPWKKNKQNMRGGRMSGNYLPYDNGYDDGGYDESYDDWAGGNAEPYLNQAYQAPDAWKRNRPNMRGIRMGGPPPFDSRNRVMGMDRGRGRGRGGRGRRGFEDEPNWGNDSFNDGGFRQRGKKRGRNSFEEPGRGQDDYDDWANNDSWNEESSFTNPRSPFSNFAWSEYERDEPSQSAENWQNQRGGRGRFDRGGGNFPRQVGPGPSPSRMPPSQMHMQEGPLIPAPRGKPMPLFAVTPGPNKGRKPSPFFGGTLRPPSPVSFVPEAGHHPHTAPVLTPSPASMPSCPVPKLSFPPGFPPFHPSRRMSPPSCVRSSAPTTLQPPPKAPRIGTPSASDSDLPPPPPPPPPMDFDVVPVPPPPPIFNPPAPSS